MNLKAQVVSSQPQTAQSYFTTHSIAYGNEVIAKSMQHHEFRQPADCDCGTRSTPKETPTARTPDDVKSMPQISTIQK